MFDAGPKQFAHRKPFSLADFILHRMHAERLTYRDLATRTGLRRSRMHYTLHRDCGKRRPLRLDEIHALLDALDITHLEATVAQEILSGDCVEPHGLDRLVGLIATIVTGLSSAIPDIVSDLDGLEWDDVRPEHGEFIQACIIRELTATYSRMIQRRDLRFLRDSGE